ncbi:MAG TPA: Tn3 family transposase [Streptosporangiaceae bacterium]|nr:Tn3 family transposase [Streptosporangiaceae bacterium]
MDWIDIAERRAGAIRFTPIEAAPRRIKSEVARRWTAVPLIDVLKETVLRTGCLQAVTSVAGSGHLPAEVLAERLMLAVYAYGTNCGIRSVASAAHGRYAQYHSVYSCFACRAMALALMGDLSLSGDSSAAGGRAADGHGREPRPSRRAIRLGARAGNVMTIPEPHRPEDGIVT